ncbi:BET1-like protein [Mizuhopecten yessoensis]|uniref:BET1-like protein n=1 Tax=Mizuhopecten yessoensis TaxID=6573 RepID=A0A210QEG9_MIZYE|nr:BET1-like protein [Mizuhopecten yessoensis]OWF47109.1 BET1-like protein [Mizuhopecten yessoensis]
MADYRNNRNGLARTDEMLDAENQQRVEMLSSKVSRLNNIALEIQTETKNSNLYLDDMTGDFESTQGLLGGTVNRLSHMVSANKGNRKLMCYIVLALVLFFFFFYYLIGRVTGG